MELEIKYFSKHWPKKKKKKRAAALSKGTDFQEQFRNILQLLPLESDFKLRLIYKCYFMHKNSSTVLGHSLQAVSYSLQLFFSCAYKLDYNSAQYYFK